MSNNSFFLMKIACLLSSHNTKVFLRLLCLFNLRSVNMYLREFVFVKIFLKDMFMFMSVNIRRSSSYTYLFSLLVWFVFVMGSRVRLFPYVLCQTCLAKSVGVGKQQQQIGGNV